MGNMPADHNDDKLIITPLPYEVLHEGRDEATEIARQRLARRRFLRRSTLAVLGLSATVSVAGALHLLYPGLAQHIGDILDIGSKADFPATTPDLFKLNHAGVFYQPFAKTYVVHLAKETRYLLAGNSLEKQLAEELFVRDTDGSYWLALYQRCVHLGTTVAFRDDCKSFKCLRMERIITVMASTWMVLRLEAWTVSRSPSTMTISLSIQARLSRCRIPALLHECCQYLLLRAVPDFVRRFVGNARTRETTCLLYYKRGA